MSDYPQLILGRCLTKMKDILDQSVDLVLADPPYGKTACFWDSIIPLEPMWEQLKRIGKQNTAFVFTASQPFTTDLISSNRKMFKYCWVWNKRKAANFVCVKFQPLKIHEDIVVFSYPKQSYFPQIVKGRFRAKGGYPVYGEITTTNSPPKKVNNTYYPKSIIELSTASNKDSGLHPTQKPVALMEYMIKTYSNEGGVVLDFCMGSGTTGVACKNLKRNFIGIELDKFYFGIAKRRIEETPDV